MFSKNHLFCSVLALALASFCVADFSIGGVSFVDQNLDKKATGLYKNRTYLGTVKYKDQIRAFKIELRSGNPVSRITSGSIKDSYWKLYKKTYEQPFEFKAADIVDKMEFEKEGPIDFGVTTTNVLYFILLTKGAITNSFSNLLKWSSAVSRSSPLVALVGVDALNASTIISTFEGMDLRTLRLTLKE